MVAIQYDGDAMICNKCQTMNEWETCLPDGTEVEPTEYSKWIGHFVCTKVDEIDGEIISCKNVQLERRGIYHAFDLLISP